MIPIKKMRKGEVRVNGIRAGVLEETDVGFRFQYFQPYIERSDLSAVSLTLPKRVESYDASVLFPFVSQ